MREDQHGGGVQQDAEAVGDTLHDGGGVGQAVEGGGQLRQDHGAAMLFPGNEIEAKSFEGTAELAGEDGGFGGSIVVEAGFGGVKQTGHRSDYVSGNQQRGGQYGVSAKRRESRIA